MHLMHIRVDGMDRAKLIISVHFGELWLKGKNRGDFVARLEENIRAAVPKGSFKEINTLRDRIIIVPNTRYENRIKDALSYVFGISWYGTAYIVDNDIGRILSFLEGLSKSDKLNGRTVRIETHRSNKRSPLESRYLVGEILKIKDRLGFLMDSHSNDVIMINPTESGTFIYTEKLRGRGGLPVGSSGKGVVLLSGGIDSPVAAYYAMKRGITPVYVHIHAFRENDTSKSAKITSIVHILDRYSNGSAVYMFPSYIFESSIKREHSRHEMLLFKRFMFDIADMVADREGATAVITGESIAQVASQTLENLHSSSSGARHIILRPLSGFDKAEIIDIAKGIGTYETSIIEYRDVCSFHAVNPSTRSIRSVVDRMYNETSIREAAIRTMDKGIRMDSPAPASKRTPKILKLSTQ